MRKMMITAAVAAVTMSVPLAAHAQIVQGTVNGSQNGYDQGNAAAGPLGGIVGGAIGAGVGAATGAVGTATGVVGAVIGADERPRFHEYVTGRHVVSSDYSGAAQVGSVLPRRGVALYPVPRDFHVNPRYRYAVVNDQTLIVDPRTRRVVEVID